MKINYLFKSRSEVFFNINLNFEDTTSNKDKQKIINYSCKHYNLKVLILFYFIGAKPTLDQSKYDYGKHALRNEDVQHVYYIFHYQTCFGLLIR